MPWYAVLFIPKPPQKGYFYLPFCSSKRLTQRVGGCTVRSDIAYNVKHVLAKWSFGGSLCFVCFVYAQQSTLEMLLYWHELPLQSAPQRLSARAQHNMGHHVLEYSACLVPVIQEWWQRGFTVALTSHIDPCWAVLERPVGLVMSSDRGEERRGEERRGGGK